MKSIFSKRVVPRKSTVLSEKHFLGAGFTRFRRDFIQNLDEMASDAEKNVVMALIKLLPNTF